MFEEPTWLQNWHLSGRSLKVKVEKMETIKSESPAATPACYARITETHFMNGWYVWVAACCCVTLQFKNSIVKWNHIISPGFIFHPLFADAWECGVFSKAAWAAHVHKLAHVQLHIRAPSAPPSNYPPTHTQKPKCKHRHKIPINPHRNCHWRTLKSLHRFVLIYDEYLSRHMNCRESERKLTSVTVTVVPQTSGYKPQGSL